MAFIIVLVGGLQTRDQNDYRTVLTSTTAKPMNEALGDCKLLPIQVYIARRLHHVHTNIDKKLIIYELYQTTKRNAGTPTGTVFWWEQDLLYWRELTEDGYPLAKVVQGKGV